VRQYRFLALITSAPVREGPARHVPNLACALTVRACCLIQPVYHHEYFPAVISPHGEPPLSPAGRAMMTIALADGEAEALFAPGQRFTIWADGIVGHTVRAEGLVGYGVISCQASPPPAGLVGNRIRRGTAGPDPGHRLAAAGAQGRW
jgi:hypothetical protein